MAYHESTKHQRSIHVDSSSSQSRNPTLSGRHHDSREFENRSDRECDAYDSHGSLPTSREERTLYQKHPQADRVTDRGRHSRSFDRSRHHYEDHDRPKMINNHKDERVDDERDRSNEPRRPYPYERYHRKDEHNFRKLRRRHWDKEHPHKDEEEKYRSPTTAHPHSSSDIPPLKAGHQGHLDEQTDQRKRSTRRHHHHTSRGRSSSRESSSSAFDSSNDLQGTDIAKEGSSSRRQDGRHYSGSRLHSHSRSRPRSESRRRGRSRSRSPKDDMNKYGRSSHSRSDNHKRKHKDRSVSREDRKRRKRKEEKDKETGKERERTKKDEERRSVLTGKKIRLKVKKDKGDYERDANRKDLLQFLNSAFE